MSVKTYKIKDVNLSIAGIPIRNDGGDDGEMITITMPKFFEHIEGAHGDAVSYETGNSVATFRLSLLAASTYNALFVALVNIDKRTPGGAGVGAFQCEDFSTGEKITGKCRLDGYPSEVQKAAQASSYTYEGRIFDVEISHRFRVPIAP